MELYRHPGRMGMKQNKTGDIEYLTFPLLEQTGMVRHLFTTRAGGISKGIYSTMNLSYTRGDEKEAVNENFRRIAGSDAHGKSACGDKAGWRQRNSGSQGLQGYRRAYDRGTGTGAGHLLCRLCTVILC